MQTPAADRFFSAAAALAIEALLLAALLLGLAVTTMTRADNVVKTLDVTPFVRPSPPPKRPAVRKRLPRHSGRAAPSNLRSRPTEIVSPPPLIVVPLPTPVVAAPVAGAGFMSRAGMAPRPGPGTGAGGRGEGLGSGGEGDGDGGGGGGTAPRRIKGRIRDEDYPPELWAAGIGGIVSVRYHVEIDGRATGCIVTASSGNAELDAMTCRLIEQRFRYRPALDDGGRAVRSTIVENHSWIIDDSELVRRAR